MPCQEISVEVADKKIIIDENIIKILNEYVKTSMSLEKLAEKLGLENWEQAYEFIKKIPAWVMWVTPTYYRIYREKCKKSSQ
jgi:hypothetical protein